MVGWLKELDSGLPLALCPSGCNYVSLFANFLHSSALDIVSMRAMTSGNSKASEWEQDHVKNIIIHDK